MVRITGREAVILGLLCEGSQYGYDLEKTLDQRNMRVWTEIGFSSIYYVLKKLEAKNLITSTVESVSGKPSRRVYHVTEQGLIMMRQKVKSVLSESKKEVSPFDLGIAYSNLLLPEQVVECLDSYLESLEERTLFLELSIHKKMEEGADYRVIALFSRPLALIKAEKTWVVEFKGEIERRCHHGKDSP
ncbi:MAG: PadR family transcriptional regulator [Theionarchaea archaeon]|nr:PadR family transcriptional regulator [Theionarchaea archaeon]MBU7039145.1 PadR family transcriptional regulator [Theionarchaea archaeon]